MSAIESPFAKEIPECKLIMRRLRKKISKYTSTHRQVKKPRDQSHDILNILKTRNLPSTIMETIRKRRTFDFLCLKNVALAGESSLEDMVKLANNQQSEIKSMFADHKLRFRKPYQSLKFQRRSTGCSSTEEDENSEQIIDQNTQSYGEASYNKQIHTVNQGIIVNNFEDDLPGFSGRGDFLSFRDQMYSEEEWLKF